VAYGISTSTEAEEEEGLLELSSSSLESKIIYFLPY
jgi:hypothetical protein